MSDHIGNGATFSKDRLHRWDLRREWDINLPLRVWICLNASDADEERNDPTVTRVMQRNQEDGFGALVMLNAFALVSTDPRQLYKVEDPIGELNDIAIARWVVHPRCTQIVCGWGNHGEYKGRGRDVLGLIRAAGGKPYALGLTKLKQPIHPLYLPYSLKPQPIWKL